MSPVSKTGRRYAAGSQVTWGGWETRLCALCGQRVTLNHSAFHSRQLGSIHVACGGLRDLAKHHAQRAS